MELSKQTTVQFKEASVESVLGENAENDAIIMFLCQIVSVYYNKSHIGNVLTKI